MTKVFEMKVIRHHIEELACFHFAIFAKSLYNWEWCLNLERNRRSLSPYNGQGRDFKFKKFHRNKTTP